MTKLAQKKIEVVTVVAQYAPPLANEKRITLNSLIHHVNIAETYMSQQDYDLLIQSMQQQQEQFENMVWCAISNELFTSVFFTCILQLFNQKIRAKVIFFRACDVKCVV
jgi:hypothetical protein